MIAFDGRNANWSSRSELNDVWRLSTSSVAWTKDQVAPNATVPAARSEAIAIVNGDQLVIFGGISNAGSSAPTEFNDLWNYDLVSCDWTKISPNGANTPPSRAAPAAGILKDGLGASYLLVYSGRHFDGTAWTVLDDLWLFSFDQYVWIPLNLTQNLEVVYTSLIMTRNMAF